MTPKQAAKSLVHYGKKHPELEMSAFIIPQVPGSIPRSHGVDGVAESLVKSKKYIIPLAVLSPEFTGGIVVAYLVDGRFALPKDATVFNVDDAVVDDVPLAPSPHRRSLPTTSTPVTPAAAPPDTTKPPAQTNPSTTL
jgi:hypothetical protein